MCNWICYDILKSLGRELYMKVLYFRRVDKVKCSIIWKLIYYVVFDDIELLIVMVYF